MQRCRVPQPQSLCVSLAGDRLAKGRDVEIGDLFVSLAVGRLAQGGNIEVGDLLVTLAVGRFAQRRNVEFSDLCSTLAVYRVRATLCLVVDGSAGIGLSKSCMSMDWIREK